MPHPGQHRRCLAFAAMLLPCTAIAAEGARLRHGPVGLFGGDIAAQVIQPGFFGSLAATFTELRGVVDDSGGTLPLAARVIPMPTGAPTGGAVRDGTYTLRVPAGEVQLDQAQYQFNLVGGYVTPPQWAGGSFIFRANLPLVNQGRTLRNVQGSGVVTPTPAAPLPAAAIGAVNTVAAAANAQVQAALLAVADAQSVDVSGFGDLELTTAWTRQQGPWRWGAGVSLHLPTGEYVASRGPNPGFGDFRTWQLGASAAYTFEGGVTVAARLGHGTNSRNRDTGYRTGAFHVGELAVAKPMGTWLVGANLLTLRQSGDDSLNGATVPRNRYRVNAAGPYLTYKFAGTPFALNLHANRTFGERNATIARTLQMRLVAAF